MSNKRNRKQYNKKNKRYTDEELYDYLASYLVGYSAQEIAAGKGTNNNEIPYERQQESVSNKLSETMRDILNTNLTVSAYRLGQMYCNIVGNVVALVVPLDIILNDPESLSNSEMVRITAIDSVTKIFKDMIEFCMLDLVKDPTNNTFTIGDNEFTKVIDSLAKELKSAEFSKLIKQVINDPELLKEWGGIAIIPQKPDANEN